MFTWSKNTLLLSALVLVACGEDARQTASLQEAGDAAKPLPEFVGTREPFAAEAVYFVVTDRFVDGDPNNNFPQQGGDYPSFDLPIQFDGEAAANIGYLGGDFKGIVDHADYIRSMGFTSLWLTPIVDNPDQHFTGGSPITATTGADLGKSGYHGYWGVNFYQLDEHLPSPGLDFAGLSQQLHDKGLKVVLDIVANHGSPSFSMPVDQPQYGEIYDRDGKLVADHKNLEPEQLDYSDPLQRWFHKEKDLAQLSNLDEFNRDVREYMINSYLYWIAQGVDAIRIDTIRHVDNDFWKEMADRIRAQYPGMFFFGEHFSYSATDVAQHQLPENGSISVLDFPGQEAMVKVFGNPNSDFAELLDYLHLNDGTYVNPYELMTFYDNHDMPRMNATDGGFIDAHNWLFTSRGIPVVYYGSETGFMRGTGEHKGNRNYFGAERIAAAKTHPIQNALAEVAKMRQQSVALQRGLQVNLEFNGNSAAFLRVYQSGDKAETALVLLNKGDVPATVAAAGLLNGGRWHNLQTGASLEVPLQGSITQELPAHSVSIWINRDPVSNAELLARLAAL
ncbi:MAG: cyclomaltodextrin glucanotransferase [Gammaproteobacteria bacterium]|nr:cyclomaltodextrin glucanotransferase [Gammaproteobacteria bacterium]